jgi:hypothetical protein
MDATLFQALGKYAGLAGISVGLILVVFRLVLKKNIFPKLNNDQAYALIRQMMYLTFAIGAMGIAAWAFVSTKGNAGHSITGHLTDRDTKRPIMYAEVTLSGRPESARSDGVGNFTLVITNSLPSGPVHVFISKDGYETFDRNAALGQNIEAELAPAKTEAKQPPPTEMVSTTETYYSDNAASGSCKDFGAWASVCSPDKPAGWTITYQHFELTGDRAGCAYAVCEPAGPITDTKACYRFKTQGHDEECGHSGNTGIHYSKGILTVVWQHPRL